MKYLVDYPPIGEVEVYVRQGMTRIRFAVSADRVRISCAPAEYKRLFPLTPERVQWIVESQHKLSSHSSGVDFVSLLQSRSYSTFRVVVLVDDQQKVTYRAMLNEGVLELRHHSSVDTSAPESKVAFKNLLQYILKQEATRVVPQRLKALAMEHGFSYSGLSINSAKSRWGSCSSRGKINISSQLMLLPLELVDFVLVHELCHTKEMNHGEDFRRLMRAVYPDLELKERQLRSVSRQISKLMH